VIDENISQKHQQRAMNNNFEQRYQMKILNLNCLAHKASNASIGQEHQSETLPGRLSEIA